MNETIKEMNRIPSIKKTKYGAAFLFTADHDIIFKISDLIYVEKRVKSPMTVIHQFFAKDMSTYAGVDFFIEKYLT